MKSGNRNNRTTSNIRPPRPPVAATNFDLDKFATSLPAISQTTTEVFGKEHYSYNRSCLRTPPDVRFQINIQKEQNQKRNSELQRRQEAQVARDAPQDHDFDSLRRKREKDHEKMEQDHAKMRSKKKKGPKSVSNPDVSNEFVPEEMLKFKTLDTAKYCGPSARNDFNMLYKHANRNFAVYETNEEVPEAERTPRAMYLREIERHNLPPLPLILRKAIQLNGVYLSNRGLGDLATLPLIEVIDSLPNMEVIKLSDNRLTDVSLTPLTHKLPEMRSLTYLDLSFNKMDDSSESIMIYLRSESCRLRVLLLNGADVDDSECANVAEAVSCNISLDTLGLAHNLIGKSELEHAVNPAVVTGGKALAEMLIKNKTLTKLDLGWNGIRSQTAEIFAGALTKNSTLCELYLCNNAFGDIGTQIIGRSLKSNQSLTSIDLSYNSLTPKAATVLANSLVFNEHISNINLNGNILGKVGAQAMVAAIQRGCVGTRVLKISFDNCDCNKTDTALFDPANPAGVYHVDLATPYGNMVVEECLYLANYRAGVSISRLEYSMSQLANTYQAANLKIGGYSMSKAGVHFHNVKLVMDKASGGQGKFVLADFQKLCQATAAQVLGADLSGAADSLMKLLKNFAFKITKEQAMELIQLVSDNWAKISVRNAQMNISEELHEVLVFEVFFALFVVHDEDFSGTMDADEFVNTMTDLSMKMDRTTAVRLMNEFDKDRSGSIDANEFSAILVNEFCHTEVPRGHIVDAATMKPWVVPKTGTVVVEVQSICEAPSAFDVGDDSGVDSIIRAMQNCKSDSQKMLIFEEAVQSPYFFMNSLQGQLFLDELCGPQHARTKKQSQVISLIGSILPQLVNAENCCKFTDMNLDDEGKLELRVKMGPMYCALLGSPTGHYVFDMKNEKQASYCRKLASIANSETKYAQQLKTNTSQHGNYSNFRNEQMGALNVKVTGPFVANCPNFGRLRFDYVSTTRPPQGTKALSTIRFDRLKERLQLGLIIPHMNELQEAQELQDRNHKEAILRAQSHMEAQALAGMKSNSLKSSADEGEEEDGVFVADLTTKPSFDLYTVPHQEVKKAPPKRNSMWKALIDNPNDDGMGRDSHPLLKRSASSTFLDAFNASREGGGNTSSHTFTLPPITSPVKTMEVAEPASAYSAYDGEEPIALPPVVSPKATSKTISPKPEKVKPMSIPATPSAVYVKDIVEPFSLLVMKDTYAEFIDSSEYFHSVYPEEKARDGSRAAEHIHETLVIQDDCKKMHEPPNPTTMSAIYPYAYQKMVQLQVLLGGVYLSCSQVASILLCFPNHSLLRVQVFTSLFSHIVDIDNMHIIFDDILDRDEREECLHRIGILNLFDPFYPDRRYRLDLRRWDHREVCKMLIVLAMTEPGENWIDETYRWSKYDDTVAGWQLPTTWCENHDTAEGGPRTFGWIILTYSSTNLGCAPNMLSRRTLRKRVLAGTKSMM